MRTIILILLLIVLFHNTKGQPLPKSYCLTLVDILEMPIFNKQFSFLDHKAEAFTIVDTNKFCFNCSIDSIEGRRVRIIDSLPSKVEMKNNYSIVVLSIGYKFRKQLISFSFWCPANGGTLSVLYEVKRKELNILGYKTGDY